MSNKIMISGACGVIALATTFATVVGVIISAYYFHRHEKYVSFHREQTKPVDAPPVTPGAR